MARASLRTEPARHLGPAIAEAVTRIGGIPDDRMAKAELGQTRRPAEGASNYQSNGQKGWLRTNEGQDADELRALLADCDAQTQQILIALTQEARREVSVAASLVHHSSLNRQRLETLVEAMRLRAQMGALLVSQLKEIENDRPAGGVVATAPGEERWVSKSDLAEYLGYTPRWIEYRVKEGMPCERKGTRLRFRISQVEAWLGDRKASA
jgi:hypothetical protein